MNRPRLFSPQRYLQKRNEVIIPSTRAKSRREWIISRGLCHYRLFVLTDIPAARRMSVLQLKMKQWSPFQDYNYYAVWQGDRVQVWLWDKSIQQSRLSEAGLKKATILPETVLHARPHTDTLQLIQCIEGVEGQIWQDHLLIGSRWWADTPDQTQWVHFQRAYGLSATFQLPPLVEQPLLTRAWGRTQTHFHQLNFLSQERTWIILGAVFFTVLLTWQIVSISKWQQALTEQQTQIDALTDRIAPILSARTQAIADKQRLEQLLTLDFYPTQLELMATIAEKLPRNKAYFMTWAYQLGELRFTLKTSKLDPTFYVRTFQAHPWFKEVKAEPIGNSQQLIISMHLNSKY